MESMGLRRARREAQALHQSTFWEKSETLSNNKKLHLNQTKYQNMLWNQWDSAGKKGGAGVILEPDQVSKCHIFARRRNMKKKNSFNFGEKLQPLLGEFRHRSNVKKLHFWEKLETDQIHFFWRHQNLTKYKNMILLGTLEPDQISKCHIFARYQISKYQKGTFFGVNQSNVGEVSKTLYVSPTSLKPIVARYCRLMQKVNMIKINF